MRTGRKETTKNWITLLNDLKQSLENKNYKYLTSIIRNNNASSYWGTFLKDNRIIYKNEQGYYKWNEKVPISIKLINAYRQYSSTMNKKDKKITVDLFNNENIVKEKNIEWVTIKDAIKLTGKSESTLRNSARKLKKSESNYIKLEKLSTGHEKILFNKEYLNNNFFKKQVPKVEVKYYNEKKNDLGLIRKFLKWLW